MSLVVVNIRQLVTLTEEVSQPGWLEQNSYKAVKAYSTVLVTDMLHYSFPAYRSLDIVSNQNLLHLFRNVKSEFVETQIADNCENIQRFFFLKFQKSLCQTIDCKVMFIKPTGVPDKGGNKLNNDRQFNDIF